MSLELAEIMEAVKVKDETDILKRRCKMEIKIKYRYPDLPELMPIDGKKSDWIDLRASEDYDIKKGEFKIIDLGVAMELPEGYEAYVVPRSSTFKNTGLLLTNSFGIIDNSFHGPNDFWCFPVVATRDVKIGKGQRIAQFRIMKKQEEIRFVRSDLEHNSDRGGVGSTGVN